MSRYLLSLKIGGEAGFGIKSAGLIVAKIAKRAGYHVFGYVEYPSLIRGGHNTYQVTISAKAVHSAAQRVDMLVALNKETFIKHSAELSPGAVVIYDKDKSPVTLSPKLRERNIKLVHVPLAKISEQLGGPPVIRNTAALGAAEAVIGLPISLLTSVIKKILGKKPKVLEKNLKAAKLGYDFVKKNYPDIDFKVILENKKGDAEILLSGNEALALGALAGGLQFYAAYPMTPSSSILHYLASKAHSERFIVKHAEDEISVINMALGASHVGARSMIGTSGGGFSLMVESLGLTGITETPLVIVEAQRVGPATGMPTWTEQADLRFIMHAAQGEFPRIILAPGDHEECFYLTAEAFNLADQYQLPVFVLTDKFLAESDRTVTPFDQKKIKINRGQSVMTGQQLKKLKDYKRYRVTPNGISPRSAPGQPNGVYLANSDEHDEFGFSSEDHQNRIAQVKKRAAKFADAAEKLDGVNIYGNPKAKITIVAWGSTKGPILDAMAWLPNRLKNKVKLMHINIVWPFSSAKVYSILSKSRKILLIENNSTAQLGGIIRQQTGLVIERKMLRYDGRPMYPADIKERIMSL